MEDLLIAVCKTPLKVGLLSSAHRGHVQTDTHLQLSHKKAIGVYL